MKVLITGSKGFVAQHLAELLEQQGHTVYGFDLKDGGDLRDYESIRRALDTSRPDRIFHLAALTYVPESFNNPRRAIEINTLGSLNLLEAVRNLGLKCRIQLAGTSEEYGDTSGESEPITERSLPNPSSPYAVAKLAMDHLGRIYASAYGMNVVVTRAYNHCGPGRGEEFAEAAFAKQIVEIERGQRKELLHGNLESIRNYTDVRDIVRAYVQAIELDPDVYNICSDRNVSMQEVLDILIANSTAVIKASVSTALYRPNDFSFKQPSCAKFKELTGWQPEYTLEQTLQDILQDWRSR